MLLPGDRTGGEFVTDRENLHRCVDLALGLKREFDVIVVDLSAGRSYAMDLVLAATAPDGGLGRLRSRWLVYHRWTRQHVVATAELTYGKQGLVRAGTAMGHRTDQLNDSIRFVRAAVPDLESHLWSQVPPAQYAWMRRCDRDLEQLAAGRGLGRTRVLASVPLEPVLQWQERLITDADVHDRRIAAGETWQAMGDLAQRLTDDTFWGGGAMSHSSAVFRETSAEPRTQSLPFSHLSLELGHLYMEDFLEGPDGLRRHFATVRPWADAARDSVGPLPRGGRPRISTCFLIDDYFSRLATPAELLPPLLEAAADAGLAIDYLARESGCAVADLAHRDRTGLAESVLHRLVESPPPGSNGFRPAVTRTGWLSNGRRAPTRRTSAALDTAGTDWQPPGETGARGHSVFMDVELWNGPEDDRTWSCAFLASVWQLLRLGLLRHDGEAVLTPVDGHDRDFPAEWDALPPVLKLDASAAPFTAYTTCSVLPARFLPVEHAVRVVLDQVHIQAETLAQVARRSAAEGLPVPAGVVDRASYVFPPGL